MRSSKKDIVIQSCLFGRTNFLPFVRQHVYLLSRILNSLHVMHEIAAALSKYAAFLNLSASTNFYSNHSKTQMGPLRIRRISPIPMHTKDTAIIDPWMPSSSFFEVLSAITINNKITGLIDKRTLMGRKRSPKPATKNSPAQLTSDNPKSSMKCSGATSTICTNAQIGNPAGYAKCLVRHSQSSPFCSIKEIPSASNQTLICFSPDLHS